jgi:anti-sigma regulatory factor (Ser/Thr protein kinase)
MRDERATGRIEASDDVCFSGKWWNLTDMEVSRPSAPGRIEFVHRSWPADPQQLAAIRRELSGWLAPLQLTEMEVADVVLAVDEAAANAVRHAYGPDEAGVVELTLWTESESGTDSATTAPATLCIEIVDHGSWRPPADRPAEGGRGIPLMQHMSESVLIRFDDRGSRVLLRHRIPDPNGEREREEA